MTAAVNYRSKVDAVLTTGARIQVTTCILVQMDLDLFSTAKLLAAAACIRHASVEGRSTQVDVGESAPTICYTS